jgi:thiol-disulfide isomerase/thioredoxin
MHKIIIAIIGTIVVVGGVYAYIQNKNESTMMEQESMVEKNAMEEKVQMNAEDVMTKDDESVTPMEKTSVMEGGDVDAMPNDEVMMKVGSYEAYSADKLARAEIGDVVLFFHASWCPSCRGLNANIESNLKSIPEGVSILKLNYDTETELKKKYGVTTQHTLVQVDANGNMIKKWSGGGSLDAVLLQII